jgi:hypothetical protein
MEEAKIKKCGHHPDSGCTCRQDDYVEHGDEDYLAGKLEDRGYPGYPSTSQADEIMKKAGDPGMYPVTQFANATTDPVVWVEHLAEHTVEYRIENIPNDQAMRIIKDILPKVMELYLGKSRDYGGNVMDMIKLGPKASFVDLWRKVGKLKRALWDDQPMVGEQADEILMDCVGHVLITLDEMKK